jgi:hypothetical protein
MNLKILTDFNLMKSFLISIVLFIYNKLLLFIIIYIPDRYVNYLIKSSYPINIDIDLLDSDDSDNEDLLFNNGHSYLKEYKHYLLLWEYDTILYLFNLKQYSFNIQNNHKLPILYNSVDYKKQMLNNNIGITFVDSCLFNIKINKQIINNKQIKLTSINNIKNKIVLLYGLSGKCLNSNIISKLYPNYRYLYAIYKYNNNYKYILVDLHNNYNLIKHKKIIFNIININ